MIIEEISIQNFRGIRQCELSKLGKINLLVGKNNAGKSSILDSLLLVSAVMFYPQTQIFSIVNRRSDRSFSPLELLYKYTQHPLAIDFKFDDGTSFQIKTERDSNEPESFTFYLTGSLISGEHRIKEVTRDLLRNFDERRQRSRLSWANAPNRRKVGFLEIGKDKLQIPEEILSFIENIAVIDPIVKTRTGDLERQFDEVKRDEKYDYTLDVLKQAYGDELRTWELSRYLTSRNTAENRTAFTYGGGRPVYVDDVGDGMKVGFAAITAASTCHNTVLLFEEIETHQHPASLKRLIASSIDMAIKNDLQLLVTTHSPDVLRYFKTLYPETRVFLIEKDLTDRVYAYDQEDLISVFRKVGWDFGNLLRHTKVALVDGREDCQIITDFYQKITGHNIESDGIGLLALRGTANYPKVLRACAISDRPLVVICDLDSKKNRQEIVKQVVAWIETLRAEGWIVEEDDDQVSVGKTGIENKWVLLKSKILAAGNTERFKSFNRHSMSDYILELVLDNPKLFSKLSGKDLSNYTVKADNSKSELESIFGTYNEKIRSQILEIATEDIIPASFRRDITTSLQV